MQSIINYFYEKYKKYTIKVNKDDNILDFKISPSCTILQFNKKYNFNNLYIKSEELHKSFQKLDNNIKFKDIENIQNLMFYTFSKNKMPITIISYDNIKTTYKINLRMSVGDFKKTNNINDNLYIKINDKKYIILSDYKLFLRRGGDAVNRYYFGAYENIECYNLYTFSNDKLLILLYDESYIISKYEKEKEPNNIIPTLVFAYKNETIKEFLNRCKNKLHNVLYIYEDLLTTYRNIISKECLDENYLMSHITFSINTMRLDGYQVIPLIYGTK